MRRVTCLPRPSTLLIPSQPAAATQRPICRPSACLRPRDFSTTPNRTFSSSRAWGVKLPKETTVQEPVTQDTGSVIEPLSTEEASQTTTEKLDESDQVLGPEETQSAEEASQTTTEKLDESDLILSPEESIELIEPQTKLRLPSEITVAPRPEEIYGYVAAKSGLGLEQVGGLKEWWEQEGHWEPSMDFVGFGAKEKVRDPALLELYTRRAVTEALAVGASKVASGSWARGGRQEFLSTLQVDIEVAEDGSANLRGDVKAVVESLTLDTTAEATPAEQTVAAVNTTAEAAPVEQTVAEIEPEEAREIIKTWDNSWKRISLQVPWLKFTVAKRIQQLTGNLIPDSKLHQIKSVKNLLSALVTPPKPTKLAQVIEQQGTLLTLPNVTVYDRRVTPIDKDKMVGRWKVIVQELEKRDLPITGNGQHDKFMERVWIEGAEVATFSKKPKKGAKSNRAQR